MISLIYYSRIETYYVTILNNSFLAWNTVYYLIIDGYTY